MLLDKVYNDVFNKIKQEVDKIDCVCATTDCWTSIQNFSYLGVSVHFLDHEMNLVSYTLAVKNIIGSHTSNVLRGKLIEVFQEWNISSKVEFMSSDNGGNFCKAIAELSSSTQMADIVLIRCLGHSINLMVKKVINFKNTRRVMTSCSYPASDVVDDEDGDEDDDDNVERSTTSFIFSSNEIYSIQLFNKLTKKCRAICSKFNHSSVLNDLLLQYQAKDSTKLHLIQEVVTRWNSTFRMIERILILRCK